MDYDIGIFETAALADQFDLGRVGRAFSSSMDLADFIAHEDNAEWFAGIHQFCWLWLIGDAVPTAKLWQAIADDWRESLLYGGLIEWAALRVNNVDPADFIHQTFREVRRLLFGGWVK